MLFTKASEYGLLAVISIAQKNTPQNVDKLSKELNISKSFLAKILQNLAKNKILTSFKGALGGFVLSNEIKNIYIFDIIKAVEGHQMMVTECSLDVNSCPNEKGCYCSLWPFLNKLQFKIDNFLKDLTLEDLIES